MSIHGGVSMRAPRVHGHECPLRLAWRGQVAIKVVGGGMAVDSDARVRMQTKAILVNEKMKLQNLFAYYRYYNPTVHTAHKRYRVLSGVRREPRRAFFHLASCNT